MALLPGLPGWAGTRKAKPIWILLKQEISEWQWHRLGHMQVCTLLQADNHANTPPLKFFCRPNALPAALETASKHWRHYTTSWNISQFLFNPHRPTVLLSVPLCITASTTVQQCTRNTDLLTDGLCYSVSVVERHESKILQHTQQQQCKKNFVYIYFTKSAFSALILLVGRQEEHPACKNWVIFWGVDVVICLELV